MSSTSLSTSLKNCVKNYQFKNSIFQGQQKRVMGTKNVRKAKSYVTKEKILKSVKGLQRNFRKYILKISQFFANISKLRPKKTTKGKSLFPSSPLLHLKIFTVNMGTPCIGH